MGLISKLRSASVHERGSSENPTSEDTSSQPLLDTERSYSRDGSNMPGKGSNNAREKRAESMSLSTHPSSQMKRGADEFGGFASTVDGSVSSSPILSGNKRRSLNHTTDDAFLLRNAITRATTHEPAIGQGSLTLEQLLPLEASRTNTDYSSAYGANGPSIKTNGLPELTVQMASPQVAQPGTPKQLPAPIMNRQLSSSSTSTLSDKTSPRPRAESFVSADTAGRTAPMQRSHSGGSINGTSRKSTVSSVGTESSASSSLLSQLSPTKSRSSSTSTPIASPSSSKSVPSSGIAGALAMSGVAIAAAGSSSTSMRPQAFTQQPAAPALSPNVGRRSRSRASSFTEQPNASNGDLTITADGENNNMADFIGRMPSFDDSSADVGSTFGFDDGFVGTGYAVASTKRNQDFHTMFQAVGEDDFLIEDYGCAIQKEILVQGRLYISEHHLCFNANIFGWVTHLVIPFSEVVTIEKRMTAYVIPNAIQVATLHSRYTFASFLARDTTYDLMTNIWRISHPNVPTSAALPDHEETYSEDSALDEEAPEDNDVLSPTKKRRGIRRRSKNTGSTNPSKIIGSATTLVPETSSQTNVGESQRKRAHRVTDIPKDIQQYANICLDEIFPSSPEKIYNLMFVSQAFMKDFWTTNQKLFDIKLSDWSPGPSKLLTRNYSYIKPLNNSMGPKQTTCNITDENEVVDYDNYVVVHTITRTPDVPSGNSFSVKTRTCITWAKNNCCRVRVSTFVEWTKRSFLSGVIGPAAIDGQKAYHKDLASEMKAYIQQHKSEFQHDQGSDGDYEVGDETVVGETQEQHTAADAAPQNATSIWTTYLGPNYGPKAEPIADMVQDIMAPFIDLVRSNSLVSGIILLLLVSNWWTLSSSRAEYKTSPRRPPGYDSPQRSPDQVAAAVKDVLSEYFGQQEVKSASKRSPADEVEDITRTLDALEERIRKMRSSLHTSSDPP